MFFQAEVGDMSSGLIATTPTTQTLSSTLSMMWTTLKVIGFFRVPTEVYQIFWMYI